MIRVGVFFGGSSREREVSFAGGRTVYDNLNKSIFEPVPIFVDSFNNFCLLDWQYIYKGSIRDFYPPTKHVEASKHGFQVYADALNLTTKEQQFELLKEIGKPIHAEDLKELMDIAFLCLHGGMAEDGTIQGLLEWQGIPYTGSGIYASAAGINKKIQKGLQHLAQSNTASAVFVERDQWLTGDRKLYFDQIAKTIGFPFVCKPATQGSSIGVSVVDKKDGFEAFERAANKAFFIETLSRNDWFAFSESQKEQYIRRLIDIREGLGLPVLVDGKVLYNPQELMQFLNRKLRAVEIIELQAIGTENTLIVEQFIDGKEFSCIVIQDEEGNPIALPPTEIIKKREVFDYRSKYLPGLIRKITPIDLPSETIDEIRKQCCEMFNLLRCQVYARIDGFITPKGKIYLNDPNTTSGMMPSSFFFHQAAEIGLNPSQFLTYIIRTSLQQRLSTWGNAGNMFLLLKKLDLKIEQAQLNETEKIKVAVVMGGYSSERHISVESGRNVYEKLASSSKYLPVPLFLTGNEKKHTLYMLPVNMMLKDNADDIRDKIGNDKENPILKKIRKECETITLKYTGNQHLAKCIKISNKDLPAMVSFVFIALHGRPGEDGALQMELDKLGLPYNGSGVESSRVTINKFETNNILRENGFQMADSFLIEKKEWLQNQTVTLKLAKARIGFPMIAKPQDDGCSSAVKKINNESELAAFISLMFRDQPEITPKQAESLNLKPKEEFPQKNVVLLETLINKGNAKHFLEITGGLLTHYDKDGKIKYEMFEPSEALAGEAILSLEEKFLAGEGQNITPPRFSKNKHDQKAISKTVKAELKRAAKLLKVEGYARIDAFVKIHNNNEVEVNIIELNSLPGMTPATAIFHQCALNGYKPYEFIDNIIGFGIERLAKKSQDL